MGLCGPQFSLFVLFVHRRERRGSTECKLSGELVNRSGTRVELGPEWDAADVLHSSAWLKSFLPQHCTSPVSTMVPHVWLDPALTSGPLRYGCMYLCMYVCMYV